MFTLTDQPDENLPTFVRDRKKWYVQGRYTSDDTSCAPKTAPKKPVKDLEKLDWDCSEQYDACGDVFNTNILYLPPEHYPLSWSANGLTKGKIELPPVTEQKFTQYFLHDNKIEKVALVSTLSLNEDYLKVTCDKSGKIESCGQDCVELTNLSVAIKNPSSMTFPIKTETMNFADLYEIELFVDQDYKSRLVDAGGSLVRNAAETLANMIQYGDLRKRPLDYVTVKIAKAANDDLIPLVGPGWRIQLRKPTASPSPAPSEPAAPEVSPQRNTQSK